MTTLREIKEELSKVTHASQVKSVVGLLLGYLEQAGVQTPAEAEQKEREMNEQRHREVAQAETTKQLTELVEGWGADLAEDDDLVRAVNERGRYLLDRERASQSDDTGDAELVETGDYASWDKPKLQRQLRARQLPVSGTKDELADRLVADDQRRSEQPPDGGDQTKTE